MKKILYDDKTYGQYELMINYDGNGLTDYQLKVLKNKTNKHREFLLKEKFPLQEQWIIANVDDYKNLVFYIKKNNKTLILKKSIYLCDKYGTGLFWIGDENIFKLSNNDFINSLNTSDIHFLKDFSIEIKYNNEWRKFDIYKYLKFDSFHDFINMHHYGYGGLIWNNDNKISHEFIYNHSFEITNHNKLFCDDCHAEIEKNENHICIF